MELWQVDIVGGVVLTGGREAKIVTGVDDHSRFCVSAYVVARATAMPTCDALALAMRRYGVPDQVLTDNGKVFTGRFGPGTGEVLFDRICRRTGSNTCSPPPARRPPPARWSASTRPCGPSSSPARSSPPSRRPKPPSMPG